MIFVGPVILFRPVRIESKERQIGIDVTLIDDRVAYLTGCRESAAHSRIMPVGAAWIDAHLTDLTVGTDTREERTEAAESHFSPTAADGQRRFAVEDGSVHG